MSYDTHKLWFWRKKGKDLFLYKFQKTSTNLPDNKGRVGQSSNEIVYPDETIDSGLRIEYTALTKTFVDDDPSSVAQATLNEVDSPSETSHVNLNHMLSLACVDFVKAMVSEKNGDINAKEYYMREFNKKLGDNQSNEKRMFVSSANPLTAVR